MSDKIALPTVTLYGRSGCHLCAVARGLLERLAVELQFRLVEVDVDTDAALLSLYDLTVPVVALGDWEVARAPLQPAVLRRRLTRALKIAKENGQRG